MFGARWPRRGSRIRLRGSRRGGAADNHRLAAFLQAAAGAGAADTGPLVSKVARHAALYLTPYMLPLSYRVVDRLPLTANAKLDRAALAALTADGELGGTLIARS